MTFKLLNWPLKLTFFLLLPAFWTLHIKWTLPCKLHFYVDLIIFPARILVSYISVKADYSMLHHLIYSMAYKRNHYLKFNKTHTVYAHALTV